MEVVGGNGRPKGRQGAVFLFWVQVVGWKKKEERKSERERRKVGVFICKGKVYYYNLALHSKQKKRKKMETCVSMQ